MIIPTCEHPWNSLAITAKSWDAPNDRVELKIEFTCKKCGKLLSMTVNAKPGRVFLAEGTARYHDQPRNRRIGH
jgi:hypothetical protein